MSIEEGHAAGLLILRLWAEPGDGIRVRVTSTTDLSQAQPTVTYASTPAEVLLLVSAWLDKLTGSETPLTPP